MNFEKQVKAVEHLLSVCDEVKYRGRARQPLITCLEQLRQGCKGTAVRAYRDFAPEYTSCIEAFSDLDTTIATHKQLTDLGTAFLALSIGMSLLEAEIA